MAIIIAKDGDKSVATIGARNALTSRFEGMQVTVLDAIADVQVGGGRAGYIGSVALNDWLLTWKSTLDNLSPVGCASRTLSNDKGGINQISCFAPHASYRSRGHYRSPEKGARCAPYETTKLYQAAPLC